MEVLLVRSRHVDRERIAVREPRWGTWWIVGPGVGSGYCSDEQFHHAYKVVATQAVTGAWMYLHGLRSHWVGQGC